MKCESLCYRKYCRISFESCGPFVPSISQQEAKNMVQKEQKKSFGSNRDFLIRNVSDLADECTSMNKNKTLLRFTII